MIELKKIFALTLIFLCLSIPTTVAYGNIYPNYWKGDKNFPFIFGYHGYGRIEYKNNPEGLSLLDILDTVYLDKNSIKVESRQRPFLKISATIIYVSDSYWKYGEHYETFTTISTREMEFFYDEETLDMKSLSLPHDAESLGWGNCTPYSIYGTEIGEAIYYLSQGKKFYGNYLWKKGGLDKDVFKYIGDNTYDDESIYEYTNFGKDYYDPFPDSFYARLDGEE